MYHHTFRTKAVPQPHDSMPGMKMDGDMSGMEMGGMDMSNMQGMNMGAADTHHDSAKPSTQQSMPMQMAPEPTLDLSTTFVWGRTKSLSDSSKENSYLAEALLRFAGKNYIWTRLENAARSNELALTPGTPLPPAFHEDPLGHVAAFTFGYDRDFAIGHHLLAAPGAQITVYKTPETLQHIYGNTPTGEVFFIRFRAR